MARMTRRQVIFRGLAAASGAGIAVVGGKTIGRTLRELSNESTSTRAAIHAQIKKAGWNEKPEIFNVQGEARTYATGPLKLDSGCHVTLVFHSNDGSYYGVRDFTTTDPQEYILRVTGLDGKQYPTALTAMRNPTKQQIEDKLKKAGITQCLPLPK